LTIVLDGQEDYDNEESYGDVEFKNKLFECEGKEFFEGVTYYETEFCVGDCVQMRECPHIDLFKPSVKRGRVWIARILRIWKKRGADPECLYSSGVDISWFYFVWDTVFGEVEDPDAKEVHERVLWSTY
jgi:hypothetical protein